MSVITMIKNRHTTINYSRSILFIRESTVVCEIDEVCLQTDCPIWYLLHTLPESDPQNDTQSWVHGEITREGVDCGLHVLLFHIIWYVPEPPSRVLRLYYYYYIGPQSVIAPREWMDGWMNDKRAITELSSLESPYLCKTKAINKINFAIEM